MVLKIRVEKTTLFIRLIENVLPSHYKVKKISLNKYWSLEKASQVLHYKPSSLFKAAVKSKTLHAIIVNKDLYFHPDTVIKFGIKQVKKEIKNKLKSS